MGAGERYEGAEGGIGFLVVSGEARELLQAAGPVFNLIALPVVMAQWLVLRPPNHHRVARARSFAYNEKIDLSFASLTYTISAHTAAERHS
jgi:hypothetical protein